MLKHTVNTNKDNKGSVTAEAALVFPLFVSVVVALINIINIVTGYEIINNALSMTAGDMSDYAYIYHEHAISMLGDEIKSKSNKTLDDVVDRLIEKLPFIQKENQLVDRMKGIVSDFLNDEIDNADNQIYIPVAGYLFKNNIKKISGKDLSAFYDDYGVVNGVDGINFSESTFFDGNNEIRLSISYEINLAIPLLLTNYIRVHQECVMNAWMSGVGYNKPKDSDNIWELDNFERGRRIRKIYGSNLPDNFPVISSFENGKVTMIKSLDFTCESYQADGAIFKKLKNFINTSEQYTGQNIPWGKDKIIIRENEITSREIILVIPSDEMKEEQKRQFDEACEIAERKNIIIRIEKHGFKYG